MSQAKEDLREGASHLGSGEVQDSTCLWGPIQLVLVNSRENKQGHAYAIGARREIGDESTEWDDCKDDRRHRTLMVYSEFKLDSNDSICQ